MIIEILIFMLGLHLMMLLLARLYRIIDLWYRIKDFWLGVVGQISAVILLDVIAYLLLTEHLAGVFLAGQLFYLVFHISIFWIGRFAIFPFMSKRH
jgi:hypothetical protein